MKVLNARLGHAFLRGLGVFLVAILLVGIAPTASAAKKMNVDQLEKFIASNKDKGDHNLAGKLYDMELTEQLSEARLATNLALLPGTESREALTAIADIAAFQTVPKVDQISDAAPDAATASAIYKSGQLYVSKLLPSLPDFFATRVITRYQATPPYQPRPQDTMIYELLHKVGVSSVTVLYKGGHEIVDAASATKPGNDTETRGLSTGSEYGEMLSSVLTEAVQGSVKWDHWEVISGNKAAVFVYTVPQPVSHYVVNEPWIDNPTKITPAYHGTVAIRPTDGAILRFTMIAEMGSKDLVSQQNMLVQYAETTIGSKQYFLPSKSVMLVVVHLQHEGVLDSQGQNWVVGLNKTLGPGQTHMNDIRFSDYH